MADLEKIAEDLSALTVLEAADLAKILEEKCRIQDFQTRKLIAKLQVFLIIALFEILMNTPR